MFELRIFLSEGLRFSIFGILVTLSLSSQVCAEEIIIDCDGEVYKYKKSFWSDPVVSVRSSAQWKPYCEEGKLKIYDRGSECEKTYEYMKQIYEDRIQTSQMFRKEKLYFKKLKSTCEKLPQGQNKFSCETELMFQDIPEVGSTFQDFIDNQVLQTEQTYIIDFYLKEISRTIEDGSNGGWSKKCELLPR